MTADRVLANTFYLYYPGQGVFETTNGGASWTNVHSGYIESNASWRATIHRSSPSPAKPATFSIPAGRRARPAPRQPPMSPSIVRPTAARPGRPFPTCSTSSAFGFGAAAPGQSYPAIYIVGYVNNVYGVWQSTNNAQSWTNIGTYPNGELDQIKTISGDPNHFGEVYVGFAGGGYAYLPAASSTSPTVTGIAIRPRPAISTPARPSR